MWDAMHPIFFQKRKVAENEINDDIYSEDKMKDYSEFIKKIKARQKCLFDDALFATSVSANPEIIDEIVRRVFLKAGISISKVTKPAIQKKLVEYKGKEIILDCYAETEDGRKLAVEIQNDASEFDHIREGYYVAKLRTLEKRGTKYRDMLPVFLIILHRHNPYRMHGLNLPIYEKTCSIKGTGIVYNDGMNVIRVNGDYDEKGDIIGDLMTSMKATAPEDASIPIFKETLETMEEKDVMEYTMENLMRMCRSDGKKEGKLEGKIEGESKARTAIAEKMRALGISEEQIKEILS